MRSLLMIGSFGAMLLALLLCFGALFTQHVSSLEYGSHNQLLVNSDGTVYQGSELIGIFKLAHDGTQVLELPLATSSNGVSPITQTVGITFAIDSTAKQLQTLLTSLQNGKGLSSEWKHTSYFSLTMDHVQPDAYPILTITAPANYFSPPLTSRLFDRLQLFSLWEWAAMGVALILFVGIYIFWRTKPVQWIANEDRHTPPGDLRPLELAILKHDVIQPLDLTAMLYYAAEQGELEIMDHGDGDVSFARVAQQEEVPKYMHNFLLLFFPHEKKGVRLQQIIEAAHPDLLKALILQSYVEIYDLFCNRGFFRESPRSIRIRYRTMGILFEIFGLVVTVLSYGLLLNILPGMIFIGISLFAIGYMLYAASYAVVPLSRLGRELVAQSAAFACYLSSETPLPWASVSSEVFFRYAPYAAVLGSMEPWLNRFREHTRWEIPSWYADLQGQAIRPDYFVQQLGEAAESIAKILNHKEG